MTERPTYPKSTCCIPGCPRWSRKYAADVEWICGRHWRAAPRRVRRALSKLWREWEPRLAREPGDRAWRLNDRLWQHLKRAVILREAGL